MPRILVVEDHPDILVNIVDYLELKGCVVEAAHDGLAAFELLHRHEYDLLVLDLTLPGLDGLDLCERLREERYAIPVVMLTARDTLDDKLRGFELGADDYLVKPFALPELWSRIQAVIKRTQKRDSRCLHYDAIEIDLDLKRATREGAVLTLNPKCFQLLELLVRCAPSVVTRDTLTHELWRDDPPDSDGLKSHVYLLRNQLDKHFEYPLLQTVHGVGYRLSRKGESCV